MKPIVIKEYLLPTLPNSMQRVLEVLFRYPEKEFSLSDLAKEAGVAKPNIGSILTELEHSRLITITKLPTIWRIKANQENKDFIAIKITHNLSLIYRSRLVEFLNDYFGNPKAIVFFGSFRKGEDISTSDIDIAIETDEAKEYKTVQLRELSRFEKNMGRRIQIHLFNKKRVDLHVFNNIANGIVLAGFLEVKP